MEVLLASGKAPFAVLSVGGFLSLGARLVVVPYDSLKLVENKIVLPGGTKERLKMLSEFKYAQPRGSCDLDLGRSRDTSTSV
jgi:hypothetical protein